MVCIILAITNLGMACTMGRNGGCGPGPVQTMPYQRMIRCMCLNSDSGRNAFPMFYGEGSGAKLFQSNLEQRDNGKFSETFMCLFLLHAFSLSKTLINVKCTGLRTVFVIQSPPPIYRFMEGSTHPIVNCKSEIYPIYDNFRMDKVRLLQNIICSGFRNYNVTLLGLS
jgi:hypothetical protein